MTSTCLIVDNHTLVQKIYTSVTQITIIIRNLILNSNDVFIFQINLILMELTIA